MIHCYKIIYSNFDKETLKLIYFHDLFINRSLRDLNGTLKYISNYIKFKIYLYIFSGKCLFFRVILQTDNFYGT